jgi:hypothetical protein
MPVSGLRYSTLSFTEMAEIATMDPGIKILLIRV